MKPSANFFGGICNQLYEDAKTVACGRRVILHIGSTPAARSRLSGTCPQLWTSTLDEVSNEKADRSPDARRVRRHDFQRRGANAGHAGDTGASRDTGDAQGGEQEGRQVRRQEKGQGQEQEGRIQELSRTGPHRPRKTQKAGPPAFFFLWRGLAPAPRK